MPIIGPPGVTLRELIESAHAPRRRRIGAGMEGPMSQIETVPDFLDRINQRDADKLAEAMTEDHVFIDSLGQIVRGRGEMRAPWRGCSAFCPDYWAADRGILQAASVRAVCRCAS